MNSWKKWYTRYERQLVTGTLVAGFLFHLLTFRALDVWTMLIWLGGYVLVAVGSIAYIHLFDARDPAVTSSFWQRVRVSAPLFTQLAFGSLLSMALLFYWFSGSLSVSWPIFLFFVLCIAVNEVFPHLYSSFIFQTTVFSFALFSYCSVLFPYLFHSVSIWTFLVGGGVSLVASLVFCMLLMRVVPKLRVYKRLIILSCVLVYAAMNVFYALNLIPPVPLSIREAGIYHNVQRIGDTYRLDGEPESLWQRLVPGQVVHEDSDGRIYAYTAMYAPKDLNIVIYHEWQRYDSVRGAWITADRLSFPMTGGSQQGYRGYTFKTRLQPGEWRVNVETERGQVVGRIPFTYVATQNTPPSVPAAR